VPPRARGVWCLVKVSGAPALVEFCLYTGVGCVRGQPAHVTPLSIFPFELRDSRL